MYQRDILSKKLTLKKKLFILLGIVGLVVLIIDLKLFFTIAFSIGAVWLVGKKLPSKRDYKQKGKQTETYIINNAQGVRKNMKKWEYKIINFKVKGLVNKKIDSKTEQQLNDLGDEGWNLVSIAPIGGGIGGWGAETSGFAFIFKRSK